jgi:cyclophilin family peptidyl-prolyl cis-trans isomerase
MLFGSESKIAAAPVPEAGGINQEVVFHTNMGDFIVELFADVPVTTANFLNYVTSNRYDGTFMHRLVKGFVLQGGGYSFDGANVTTVPAFAPITNEYSATHPNALGTIAMARTSDLNSATSQFFFNLVDNSAGLVNYAVFGQVIQGWDKIVTIAGLPVYDAGAPFDTLPLQNYSGTGNITAANLVVLNAVDVLAIATADSFGVSKSGTVGGSLTANDTDLDDTVFTIAKVNGQAAGVGQMLTLPSGAHVTVNANGTFSYDPNHAFDSLGTGQGVTDSFTYTLANGSLVYGSATVSIGVAGSGGAGPNILGTLADDTLVGTAGNDVIDGLAGADSMRGFGGNDTYYADRQTDVVYEAANDGTDTVIASAGYYLYANIENLTLASFAGNVFGVGNDLDNTITGNGGDNTLLGGAGGDTIHAGDGVDIVYGESGADWLYGEGGNDVLVGGTGDDFIDGGAGGDSVYGEDGNDTLSGGSDFVFDQLVGGAGNDTLHGDSGLGDFDYLIGNDGDDTYWVDTPADLVFENAGEGHDTVYANISGTGYYLYANIEDLILVGTTPFGVGNELDNHITGNGVGNYLLGGAGNDTLNGLGGDDVLYGEAGADIFVFGPGSGADTIADFVPGTDRIDLSAIAGFFTSFADVQAHMVENGGTTAINLGGGSYIVINGVTNAQLHAGDFILAGGSAAVVAGDPDGAMAAVHAAMAHDFSGHGAMHDLAYF